MTYRDMVTKTLKTTDNMLLHAAMGLCGESGEVIELIKKRMFHKPETSLEPLIQELGDIRWYLELAAIAIGVSMDDIEHASSKKLQERYKYE